MITTKNVGLTIKHKTIIDNASISLPKGSITAFIGKSGAGKTSLLKCIAQLYTNYSGDIAYQGVSLKTLPPQQRVHAIGYVFQQFNLFPHLTVLENCIQPQLVNGTSIAAAQKKADDLLDALDLAPFKKSYPSALSGGQQQRVAIARALALEPQVLLFDEPSSALDPQSTQALASLLKNLNQKGITIGFCSHDVSFIKNLLDRVYLLENGKIIDQYQATDSQMPPTSSPIGYFLSHG